MTNQPLNDMPVGSVVKIVGLEGGGQFRTRLSSMGLSMGCVVEVVQNRRGGPLLVSTGESRIALGHGMASKILVAPAD